MAVCGEIAAVDNGYGVTGIANGASIGAHSVLGITTADIFELLTSQLDPGDIVVVPLHCPGPAATGTGQYGFVPIEWWQANFDVIATASANGVICCAAAGNWPAAMRRFPLQRVNLWECLVL